MEGQRLNRLWRARGPILAVARSPKERLLALAPSALEATVVDLATPARPTVRLRHPNTLCQCCFSPDGKWFATACSDQNARVWPASDLTAAARVLKHERNLKSISFDPTGQILACLLEDGGVRLWNAATGGLVGSFNHQKPVNQFEFSADGSLLAAAGSDAAVHFWSVAGKNELANRTLGRSVNCLGFVPGRQLLFAGSDDGTVRAWDTKTFAQEFDANLSSPVVRLAFTADGTLIAAGCRDGRIHVWNVKTKAPLSGDFRHEQSVRSLSFSKDGQTLVSGGEDDLVRLWDLKSGLPSAPPFVCGGNVVWAELNADEQHVMAAGLDGILREWSLRDALRSEHRCENVHGLQGVQLSPGGRWLLLLDRHQSVLCDLEAAQLSAIAPPNTAGTLHAAFSADGKSLVLADKGGDLSVWDLSLQPRFVRRQAGAGPLTDVRFSPDGQSLVTANVDGTAHVFSEASPGTHLTLRHGAGLKLTLFGDDGHIYTAGGGRRVCLWDLASQHVIAEFPNLMVANIGNCIVSRDDRLVLVTWREAPAAICKASTLEPIRTIVGSPISACFSADGTRLVTTDEQYVARVYDVSAKELARPARADMWPEDKVVPTTSPHRAPATCSAIRDDGTLIATGSDDTNAQVWDAETGEPVSPAFKHTDHVIFVAFREHGNQLVTVSADAVIRLWTLDDGTPSERLIHLARATSGQRIDSNGTAVVLMPREIEAEWNAANAANDARGESQ